MTVTASLSNRKKMDSSPPSIMPRLIGFAILILVDAFFIWFISKLIPLGYFPLAAAIIVIAVFVNSCGFAKEGISLFAGWLSGWY